MKQLLGIALLAGALAVTPGIAGATSIHKTGVQTVKAKGKKHTGTKHAGSGTARPASSDAMKPAK
jgi:hypothetical protein